MTATELLIQFLGFLLQTLPISTLMAVSFDAENLRLSRKKTAAIFLVPDIICSLGFAVWEISSPTADYNSHQNVANIIMTAFMILMFSLFFRFIKAPILNKLSVLTILTHYAAILFTVNGVILAALDVNSGHIYSTYELLSNLILTAATFPVLYLFILKIVRPAMNLSDNKVMRRGLIYFCLAFLLFCAAVMFFDFSFERGSLKNIRVAVFFTAFIITDCILYYMFFAETRLVAQNMLLEDRIRSLNEQYRRISRGIEESRRLRHDMRHHLSAISTMNRNGETEEITKYLEEYSAAYRELDGISLCGYHALDNILSYYLSLAREKGIAVKTQFHKLSPDMDFAVTDITILMGNLLENAIEACEQLEGGESLISVKIRQTGAELLIMTENTCRSDLDLKTDFTGSESFISTKHTRQSGQGLKSISLVAEKYGGSAEFKCENGVFTARAVLNIP